MQRSHRLSSLFTAAVMAGLSVSLLRMSDPTDTGSAAPASTEPEAPAAAPDLTTVTIADVPAAHADLLERVGALLKKDLGWLKDNIEAGISHFEGLFKDDTPPAA